MSYRDDVESYFRKMTGRRPDLENPRSYNDKVTWCKLFDQMPEHKICCDKLAVRGFVAERIGAEHLVELVAVGDSFSDLNYPGPCIAKATHDSGSAVRVRDAASWDRAREKITPKLGRTYGVKTAEWAYRFATPRVICERILKENNDYRVHCCAGAVQWVQVSTPKDLGPVREWIFDRDGRRLPLHLAHPMTPARDAYRIPDNWDELLEVAEKLSADFGYVRVDLYSSEGRVWFSELTFWPRAGVYVTDDNLKFGEMMDLDTSVKRAPVVC